MTQRQGSYTWAYLTRMPRSQTDPSAHQLTTELMRRGVSAEGVRQLLSGNVVSSLGDRLKFLRLLGQQVKSAIEQHVTQGGVNGNELFSFHGQNDVNRTIEHQLKGVLHELGLSAVGVQQLFAGLSVTDPQDRQRLAEIFLVAFDPRASFRRDGTIMIKGKDIT